MVSIPDSSCHYASMEILFEIDFLPRSFKLKFKYSLVSTYRNQGVQDERTGRRANKRSSKSTSLFFNLLFPFLSFFGLIQCLWSFASHAMSNANFCAAKATMYFLRATDLLHHNQSLLNKPNCLLTLCRLPKHNHPSPLHNQPPLSESTHSHV